MSETAEPTRQQTIDEIRDQIRQLRQDFEHDSYEALKPYRERMNELERRLNSI